MREETKKGRVHLTRAKRIHKIILADGHTLFRRGLRTLLVTEADLTRSQKWARIDEALAVSRLLHPMPS